MTRCADIQAKQALRALFVGELDTEGFERLCAHASKCAECREAYDRLTRVESALEKRALPQAHEALMEQALFARLGLAQAPARVSMPERPRVLRPRFFVPAAVGLALAATVVLVVVPRVQPGVRPQDDSGWQARGGGAATSAFGIRAFCVEPGGSVRGEARSGGTLTCAEGNTVQFSYTAPQAARLQIEATSAGGEPLHFFPQESAPADVAAGVDSVLPYSTPVQRGWLPAPLDVRATFSDAKGRVLSQTRLRLSP